jgi:hypothetical protein
VGLRTGPDDVKRSILPLRGLEPLSLSRASRSQSLYGLRGLMLSSLRCRVSDANRKPETLVILKLRLLLVSV